MDKRRSYRKQTGKIEELISSVMTEKTISAIGPNTGAVIIPSVLIPPSGFQQQKH